MTAASLVCARCGLPVTRMVSDRGPRRRWLHADPRTGRPVPADHRPTDPRRADMELPELGALLDAADEAAQGGSNDAEIDALRAALDHAVALLDAQGHEIPREPEV